MREKQLTINSTFEELESLLKKKFDKSDNEHKMFLNGIIANIILQKKRFEQVYKENHD